MREFSVFGFHFLVFEYKMVGIEMGAAEESTSRRLRLEFRSCVLPYTPTFLVDVVVVSIIQIPKET